MIELIIKNANVVTEDGVFFGDVAVDDGKIVSIGLLSGSMDAKEVIDAEGKYLLPGGVDPHVHVRYPSHPERGTFETETRAAAAGGVTTIIEHPISMPPQYSSEILLSRVKSAEEQSVVDVAFLGAAGGEKIMYIREVATAGIVGYKTFLHAAPEGRDKEFVGLTMKDNYELYKGFNEVKETGLPMSAHAEDNDLISGLIKEFRANGKTTGIDHAKSRPSITEVLSVERLLRFSKETGVILYLVHISTPEAVRVAKKAREAGQKIYIETCPHYLYLNEESLVKYGSYAKCNPPLRSKEEADGMWEFVMDGSIDTIGSDHSPFTVEEKERNKEDIFVAPSGFPGIESRLPLMMTAVKEGKISLSRAVDLLSTNPSKIFGLYPKKGAIKIGADADFALVDLEKTFVLNHNHWLTKAKDIGMVYDGKQVCGKIMKTLVRGKLVYDAGEIKVESGYGKWVKPVKNV
ncbi:MAG TPA: allantoinase AllB [Clostridia bacterium]|nr:allantoinase AllB [Clostridia bacterium]